MTWPLIQFTVTVLFILWIVFFMRPALVLLNDDLRAMLDGQKEIKARLNALEERLDRDENRD